MAAIVRYDDTRQRQSVERSLEDNGFLSTEELQSQYNDGDVAEPCENIGYTVK